MILYFSGTGNTRHCALALAEALGEVAHDISPRASDGKSLRCDDARIVWMFPIYSWGVPPVVADIIGRIDIDGAAAVPHYMVATCGDDAGNADRMWRSLMGSRGWRSRAAYTIQMPNTYVCMPGFDVDGDDVRRAKLAAVPSRIASVAQAVSRDYADMPPCDMVVRGRFAWLKTSLIYPWFKRHGVNPRRFAATDACVGCGMCARRCPTENIAVVDGKPQWGTKCAMCLACYHCCSHHAVGYGRVTRGKGQYRGPEQQ